MGYKRRSYIIQMHKELQMKITLAFVTVSLLGSIISAAAFNFFALRKLETLMWSTHINVKDTGEIIRPLFVYVNIFNFVFIAILLGITILWMMRLKSGPIYRMVKDIMQVAGGDLSTIIALRQKDEFQVVAKELNEMTESLRRRFTVLNDTYTGISDRVGEIRVKAGDDSISPDEYDLILKQIDRLERETGQFQLRSS